MYHVYAMLYHLRGWYGLYHRFLGENNTQVFLTMCLRNDASCM